MPIRFKDATVNPHGLHPRVINQGLVAAEKAFREVGGYVVTITSVCDGVHSSRSYHYLLGAVDLRSKNIATAEEKKEILRRMRRDTPDDFDILLEHLGRSQEHYHCEYDAREELEDYLRSLQREFMRGLPPGLELP